MKLLIAGDLSLQDRAVRNTWDETSLIRAFNGIRIVINDCDHAIVNLESPVTEDGNPIVKDGPTLKNHEGVFDIIKFCGFDTVTLANNHLKDYGFQGVNNTIAICEEKKIASVGAGCNLSVARKPYIYGQEGFRVGVINVCEHESSIATKEMAGTNPLDLTNLYYDIKSLKEQADKIIVIIHGGCEHYQLPTPRMKSEYHLLLDFGADVIVNHHQHCYSGYELYKGKPIFYGLGNFYFDNPRKRKDKWNNGLLLRLDITKETTHFDIIPFNQCEDDAVIIMKEYGDIKGEIEELNSIIADDNLLNEHFDRFVISKKPICPFLPYGNHYLRALFNRGVLPDGMSNLRKVKMENVVSCESHREVLLRYFEIMLKHE